VRASNLQGTAFRSTGLRPAVIGNQTLPAASRYCEGRLTML